ncbi:MAG: hypothetical protein NFCOHLIN_00382 [Gammaproteobacteria bacterium]|nr:hypothetical protein [Gammaproteobacteria bacterium]
MQDAHPSHPGVVRLRVGRSRSLRFALLPAHLGAAAAVLLVDGPWWAATGLAIVVMISAAAGLARHFGNDSDRVHELVLRTDGRFEVMTAAGQESAELWYVSLAEPWLTVFGVRSASGRRHDIVLLRDNVEPEPFRRLRVRLRQPGRSVPAGADAAAGDGMRGGPRTSPRGGARGPGH